MDRHYAPGTSFMIAHDLDAQLGALSGKRVALIRFAEVSGHQVAAEFILSPAGSTAEAALNLFRILRDADSGGFDAIIAESVPDEGLGRAVNDRLRRAAYRGS
jgi:L-threonylcarbamoyladenylate synthase